MEELNYWWSYIAVCFMIVGAVSLFLTRGQPIDNMFVVIVSGLMGILFLLTL